VADEGFHSVGRRSAGTRDPDDEVSRFVEAYQRAVYARLGRPLANRARLEDPVAFAQLQRLAAEIQAVAAEWLGEPPSWPAIATLPSGEVNALAHEVPGSGGRYAVFFDDGLLDFTNLFATATGFAMPISESPGGFVFSPVESKVRRRLVEDGAPAARFLEVMVAYVVGGDALTAGSHDGLDQRWTGFGELRGDAMNLFVLGHEFGHVIARHSRAPSADPRRISADLPPEVDDAWFQEFQADTYGTRLSMAALLARNYGVGLCAMGAELFFGAVDTIDRTVSMLEHGDEEHPRTGLSHTHPPASLRREFFRTKLIPQLLPEEAAAEAVTVCETTEQVISLLWETIRPSLVELHKAGFRPALQF
jgi:hypothetical protein